LLTFIFIIIYKIFIVSLSIKLFSTCSLFNMLFIYLSFYIFEILGDLFASIMKRYKRIKNISNILPGHGGILDRFDSLLPTFFCVYIFYKNIYVIHMLTYL
jgi:CDP-diglyceride synthetase